MRPATRVPGGRRRLRDRVADLDVHQVPQPLRRTAFAVAAALRVRRAQRDGRLPCGADPLPEPVSKAEVLRRLRDLPVSTWTYEWEHDDVRHLGPMAQDFWRTFGLGTDDQTISTSDANGVLVVAVQALAAEVDALRAELQTLREQHAATGAPGTPGEAC